MFDNWLVSWCNINVLTSTHYNLPEHFNLYLILICNWGKLFVCTQNENRVASFQLTWSSHHWCSIFTTDNFWWFHIVRCYRICKQSGYTDNVNPYTWNFDNWATFHYDILFVVEIITKSYSTNMYEFKVVDSQLYVFMAFWQQLICLKTSWYHLTVHPTLVQINDVCEHLSLVTFVLTACINSMSTYTDVYL